ncbi:ADP-ribosylglycohydrolase family protein [Olsenella sp. HMSC062G07]|uniref:ADP-ribosylglycohydrolase family protein n=1 Tax=Olsenella sp. HMSC062G07 TaxID=1739330 RepID=UPI0008A392C6|nr:ADP-ribosylglycohydrolase family protein [Olsenella sp. HMSC062G07]OFK24810.1 ADP-ribosylglycohydrolase [Olsenella sp. HMSC062G07]
MSRLTPPIDLTTARGLADAVWGEAVGDALGVPFEGLARDSFTCTDMVDGGRHQRPAGTWSDDTAMTIATCDSIKTCGRADIYDLRLRFESWMLTGAYTVDGCFSVGRTTRAALTSGHGLRGEWDNGNGSLMRICPLAFCDASDDDVRDVSGVTHAHHVSYETCVDFVHLLREAARDPVALWERLALEQGGRPRRRVRSTGFVRDTFDAALWSVGTTRSYRECVLAAVNLGDDSDSTAAVAGALAGVIYGAATIPAAWMDRLRGKGTIEECLF